MAISKDDKLIAIFGGGDWADASIDHLIIPKSVNLEEAKSKYREWCRNYRDGRDIYYTFSQFLIKECGAREVTDEIEYFEDY